MSIPDEGVDGELGVVGLVLCDCEDSEAGAAVEAAPTMVLGAGGARRADRWPNERTADRLMAVRIIGVEIILSC